MAKLSNRICSEAKGITDEWRVGGMDGVVRSLLKNFSWKAAEDEADTALNNWGRWREQKAGAPDDKGAPRNW